MATRGKFITLEGGEGAGKSTQLRALAAALRQRGLDVVETREPGGSEGAETIRSLLLDPAQHWSARTEALLFAAARADHVEKTIAPALAAGQWVVSDRFLDSSLAYQGAAGGLGIDAIEAINRFGVGELMPDRTIVLEVADGEARVSRRDGTARDRIGGRDKSYHDAVAAAFRAIAGGDPQRVRIVDGSASPEAVAARILDAVADLLP